MLTYREESRERRIIDVLTTREEVKSLASCTCCQLEKKIKSITSLDDTYYANEQNVQRQKTLRLPRKIDVFKFIGKRRSKCTSFNLKMYKNTFHLRQKPISKETDDDEDKTTRRQSTKKEAPETSKKRKIARACQRKCKEHFLQRHKTLHLPRKMDVLKFIGKRRSKCTRLNLKT